MSSCSVELESSLKPAFAGGFRCRSGSGAAVISGAIGRQIHRYVAKSAQSVGHRIVVGLRGVWAVAHRRHVHRQNRRAFQHMLSLEEHLLEDIGVSREDVLWANRQPLRVNAAVAMHERARSRQA